MRYIVLLAAVGFVCYASFLSGVAVGVVHVESMLGPALYRCVELIK